MQPLITSLRLATAVLFAMTLPTAPALGDILQTKDGRTIDGPTMERTDQGILIHFENGDISVPNELVQDVFLSADLANLPKKRKRQIEAQVKQRKEQIQDALAHSNWGNAYETKTRNFRWKYTLPEHIAEYFMVRLESYYEAFAKEWRIKRDKGKEKLMINFFANRKEFHRTSGAPSGALAYFMFLGDYDLCCFYDRLDLASTEMVLYHEASHYLQKLLNEDFKMPHWPGEGISEYYGGALWDAKKKKLDVGLLQDGRLTEIKQDISLGKMVGIRSIVTTDAYTDYTWGWALVHFFMNDAKLKKGFLKYAKGLANAKGIKRSHGAFNLKTVSGEESLRYLQECLGIKNEEALGELEVRFHTYVQDLQIDSASGLEKAAMGAVRAGKYIRARRLFNEAEEAGGLTATGCYQYAKIVRGKDKDLAKNLYERATELDPLTGTFWYEYGRLLSKSDEEEATRLKLLAQELDPEVGAYDIDFEDLEESD